MADCSTGRWSHFTQVGLNISTNLAAGTKTHHQTKSLRHNDCFLSTKLHRSDGYLQKRRKMRECLPVFKILRQEATFLNGLEKYRSQRSLNTQVHNAIYAEPNESQFAQSSSLGWRRTHGFSMQMRTSHHAFTFSLSAHCHCVHIPLQLLAKCAKFALPCQYPHSTIYTEAQPFSNALL